MENENSSESINYEENVVDQANLDHPESDQAEIYKNKSQTSLIVGVIIISSFFGSVFGFMASRVFLNNFPDSVIDGKNESGREALGGNVDLLGEDSKIVQMVEKASPAVVSISATKQVKVLNQQFDWFNFNWNIPEEYTQQQVSGGSGFLVSSDGMIVTNKHVVEDEQADYSVTTNDGQEYSAHVLARDPVRDIAIIKIEGSDFPVLELGSEQDIHLGQTVIAIGNSLGEFSNTISKGIVSGLGRTVMAGDQTGTGLERLTDIIQTDAAINPGNSGGPLINLEGKVVGVNVAMAVDAQNIGFALPIDQIEKVVSQVKQTGKISTPFLGVRYLEMSAELQKENNLPYTYGVLVQRGAKVSELAVIPGSPADKAGIMENDIILEFDGIKIDKDNPLEGLISSKNVGDRVNLKVWSKGKEKEVGVVLEERIQ